MTVVGYAGDGLPILFVHVPRSGGRSVARWLGLTDYRPHHEPGCWMACDCPTKAHLFGVLRCPFERTVSEFRFRYPEHDPRDFERWVCSAEDLLGHPNWSAQSMLRGAQFVPFAGVEDAIRRLFADLGARPPPATPLPHVLEHPKRPTETPRPFPLDAYLTDKAREVVARCCAWDIAALRGLECSDG